MRGATIPDTTVISKWTAFQSTPPVRGATVFPAAGARASIDFNPHSPCGERLPALYTHHLPPIFQSTLPVRGATLSRFSWLSPNEISIHAPRAGSDRRGRYNLTGRNISIHAPRAGSDQPLQQRGSFTHNDFNPRSPCGERHKPDIRKTRRHDDFNPRPPCGERQRTAEGYVYAVLISIHAPRAGGDQAARACSKGAIISIHAPRAGGDGEQDHCRKRHK